MELKIDQKLREKPNASQYPSKEAKRCKNVAKMVQKWSKSGVKMKPKLNKNERKNLSKSSEARWNIWGKSKNKSNRNLRKIIETPREKLRKIPGRSIEHLRKIVWKSMGNRYRGEVFIKTVRGRAFRWNGTGTSFSLKRYGDEVFTRTVRGRCFHSNGTGAKRYGIANPETSWRILGNPGES